VISRPRLVLAALIAVGLGGCSTFTNTDTAAKLGDAELTVDELGDQIEAGGATPTEGRVSADLARQSIGEWLYGEVAADEGLLAAYGEGDPELALSCLFVVQVADRSAADAGVERLAGDESWGSVVAEVAPDAPDEGRQPCTPIAEYPPEIAEQISGLEPGGAAGVVTAPDGSAAFVARAQSADELDVLSFLNAVATAAPARIDGLVERLSTADVYVNPQYGTFDGESLAVVPLG